jgi:threonine synthase
MGEVYRRDGVLVDPHTAVGLGAAARCRQDPSVPMVALATAHPAKFPDAVEAATGVRPALPGPLADLFERPERFDEVPLDSQVIRATIESYLS